MKHFVDGIIVGGILASIMVGGFLGYVKFILLYL